MPIGAAHRSEKSTRQNVPIKGAQIPPAVMRLVGFCHRNPNESTGHALYTRCTRISTTGTTSASAIIMKMNFATFSRRRVRCSTGVATNGCGRSSTGERCAAGDINGTASSGSITIWSPLSGKSVMLPPPNALHDQVGRYIHDEHEREQHDADQKQHAIMVI